MRQQHLVQHQQQLQKINMTRDQIERIEIFSV